MKKPNEMTIPVKNAQLFGILTIPSDAAGLILFVHGSGSGRHSPRNQYVASVLNQNGFATLLFDLLTAKEEEVDNITAELRFDIPFLTERVISVINWVAAQKNLKSLPLGLFGASTGAAAALKASVQKETVKAIVSRGGRPDMAYEDLAKVTAPTLLIVGENDREVIKLNEEARNKIPGHAKMLIIPNATHLFEEEGTLEQAAKEASKWFLKHL
ncbi:MAG: dienelactone hydrolase family protein [Simkaniaceae bacterium]